MHFFHLVKVIFSEHGDKTETTAKGHCDVGRKQEARNVMSALELKIPPVLVTLIFATLMWLLTQVTPAYAMSAGMRYLLLAGCLALATTIGLSAVAAFKKASTTVNPLRPDDCSSLVSVGIFRRTRNPMYLALLLALLGWGAYLANPFSLTFALLFIPYMNHFQIRPEEAALENAFGDSFRVYCKQVRRWV